MAVIVVRAHSASARFRWFSENGMMKSGHSGRAVRTTRWQKKPGIALFDALNAKDGLVNRQDRRRFPRAIGAAAISGSASRILGANGRVNVAVIGLEGRGGNHFEGRRPRPL
jgi:hypothetical protein